MKKPKLMLMAAGMGSRYGGLKQIDKVSKEGEILMDFSLYDAKKAGFEDVIFIIRKEHEAAFKELVDAGVGRYMNVQMAFQELSDLPEGYEVPEGRQKPWGTCHAVMAARHLLDGPFVVINADDYYGPDAFQKIFNFFQTETGSFPYSMAMVSYMLKNTLSEQGSVARGVCNVDQYGYLNSIVERTEILKKDGKICYKDGERWYGLSENTPVSMNMWGFGKGVLESMIEGFPAFLDRTFSDNPLKGEYFLPYIVEQLIASGKGKVRVFDSTDKWYGMTYKEEKNLVAKAIERMKTEGLYPEKLWP